MDYLKNVVPSVLIKERGSNLVVINPGSANVRIGFAHQTIPFNIPHCIARHIREPASSNFMMDNSEVTPAQRMERENAYDVIASLLKIPFLDEEATGNSISHKIGQDDDHNPLFSRRTETTFAWTDVMEKEPKISTVSGSDFSSDQTETTDTSNCISYKFREFICGDEAINISSSKPYCLCHPIRRGHLNVSQHYSMHQVLHDIFVIWDWILNEKLRLPLADRNKYSVVLVIPETFDSREIKELLSIVLQDLRFSSAVIHQEGLAAVSGNGLSTACVVNLGAQVTSIICIEDGVALPSTIITLPFGGDDISRCLLWIQETNQSWPNINTKPLHRPIDLFMLNKLKESYCQIREGEFVAMASIYSYDEDMPVEFHKSRLSALNVPPMGLFFPKLLAPEVYPPPSNSWFHDFEDMTDDTWRSENSDNMYLGSNSGTTMWDGYPIFPTRNKWMDKVGLAEAITSSILSAGRIDLQRKLFCSIQLIGGAALTSGIVATTEERVLHAIPPNEAIDTVEVLQSRSDPAFVSWKGGAILSMLDFGRECWIYREDWIKSGIHVGRGRKYKDSYYLHALAMSYISS
ncbi:Actin-related protein 9 [Zostera marina]|uniref:Actin-related protein 9 n=1 Tax=Zostera marina TaxID=29655 RepID=A0A0K9PNJ1_ZOSMR|nr:Actin-related protein 9 [Zostera marina]